MAIWSGKAAVKGGSEIVRMALLTFVGIGVTFTWGVEMTYCTPYLLSLGLTKGQTSLVWIAGPLSGLVVQPIVGVISDGSKSRWGRRRPIIVVCAGIVALGLLTLGFTREIVGLFVSDGEFDSASATGQAAEGAPMSFARVLTIVLAVLSLYVTDFAINAVMSCSRSLVVDTLPIQKQQSGAAWHSRMSSIGHIVGYGAGAVNLPKLLGPTLGDTQFKQLTVIAAAGMLASAAVTCWAVSERVLLSSSRSRGGGKDDDGSPRLSKVVHQIWSTLLHLPPRIQAICWVVFWSWIGWYPFMIYSSTWVGETYFRYDAPPDQQDSGDAFGDMGRIGSYALTVYSLVTFLGAWILPLLVSSPDDDASQAASSFSSRQASEGSVFARIEKIRNHPEVTRLLARFNHAKPDLLTVWFVGHLIFAASMSLAPFASSFLFATVLVAICGIPWTIANWAPTAFVGVEVNRLTGAEPQSPTAYRRLSTSSLEMGPLPSRPSMRVHDEDEDEEDGLANGDSNGLLEQHHTGATTQQASAGSSSSGGELSGIYFGILNIYITLPQFVGTLISAVVFALLEPGKSPELATDAHPSEHHSTDGPNAIAVCLFIGAISAVGSAYATTRLRKM